MSNTNPVLISSGVTVTAASIVPAVEWALNGFAHPIPESVSAILAGLLVAAVHLGIQYVNAKIQASKLEDEPVPPASATTINIPQFSTAPVSQNTGVGTPVVQNTATPVNVGQAPITLTPKA